MPPFVPVAVKVTVVPEHTLVAEDVMLTVGVNIGFIEIDKLLPVPVPQELIGKTEIFPAVEPKFTEILFVPAPEAIVAPAGKVQL